MILAMIFLVDVIFHLGIRINFLCQLIYLTSKGYAQEELFTGVLENCCYGKNCKTPRKTPVLASIYRTVAGNCFCQFDSS